MRLDRALGDTERLGDFGVALSLLAQGEHVPLTERQTGPGRFHRHPVITPLPVSLRALPLRFAEEYLSPRRPADGADQPAGRLDLGEEAQSASSWKNNISGPLGSDETS